MIHVGENMVRGRTGFTFAGMVGMVLVAFPGSPILAQNLAQVASVPERLSWYGDQEAPNISGVWVRVAAAGATAANKEGWLPWPPPLKAQFAATWAQRIADTAGKRSDDPVRGCLPPGMPRYITGTNGPMLITQTPGRVTLYRDGIPVRRVWLDRRPLPASKDLESFSNGNAVGHYEGSDLVTEVIGILSQPIDSTGVPHSGDLRIVERFHRVDATTLRVEVTLTDSTAYARPMTSTVTYTASNDALWEPKEFLCTPRTDYHPEKYVH